MTVNEVVSAMVSPRRVPKMNQEVNPVEVHFFKSDIRLYLTSILDSAMMETAVKAATTKVKSHTDGLMGLSMV